MFIKFINFYRYFISSFSKISVFLNLLLRTKSKPTNALLFTYINYSKVISCSNKIRKSLLSSKNLIQ